MLRSLDSWLIDQIFQKIADWVDSRIGRTCFWLAKMCAWAVVIFWAASLTFFDGYLSVHGAIFTVWSVGALAQISQWERKEKNRLSLTAERVLNPDRMSLSYLLVRIATTLIILVLLPLAPIMLLESKAGLPPAKILLDVLQILSFWGSIYFSVCTPKPPKILREGNPLATHAALSRT